uniref:Uncharacterized protein n=1 Tax=Anguilla anguilla TaxID=7936 RepID=A0A0E9R342_ANGAN
MTASVMSEPKADWAVSLIL